MWSLAGHRGCCFNRQMHDWGGGGGVGNCRWDIKRQGGGGFPLRLLVSPCSPVGAGPAFLSLSAHMGPPARPAGQLRRLPPAGFTLPPLCPFNTRIPDKLCLIVGRGCQSNGCFVATGKCVNVKSATLSSHPQRFPAGIETTS